MSYSTPILIITFNRPNHTRQVWEEIKKQKPKQVFVFQDGARVKNETDIKKCADVRAIFEEKLDWECDLQTFYSETNLGCGKGPASAITWFFENVEEGLIFEDDCLPSPDFFRFCNDMLDRYRHNEKISFIGGTNFQDGNKRGTGSYYFSAGHHGTWGWATWRRTWKLFDYYLSETNEKDFRRQIRLYFRDFRQIAYWIEIFRMVKKDRMNESCWDYQFYFACWKAKMLAVIPSANLVKNIGFDESATHTTGENSPFSKAEYGALYPLSHLEKIQSDRTADHYLHKTYIRPNDFGLKGWMRIFFILNKKIKSLLGIKSWRKRNG